MWCGLQEVSVSRLGSGSIGVVVGALFIARPQTDPWQWGIKQLQGVWRGGNRICRGLLLYLYL